MVYKTVSLYFAKSHKTPRKYLQQGFIDSLRLYVRGGRGGNGLPKFGGVGGQGGNVIFVANDKLALEDVLKQNSSKRIFATHGKDSGQNFILGTPGADARVEVPTGITVYDAQGIKLGELNKPGDEVVAAKGGSGGHPNNGWLGTEGDRGLVRLDLKLIADVGLVGFPNAGKSTLLKAISHAKPKVASYPFTTIRPNVGILKYKDFRQISMADLPGLIEGAHANKGMGHKFLKHVERTNLILFIVDINGFQLSPQHKFRSCLDTIVILNKELELYNRDLLSKPTMILINKMDSTEAHKHYSKISKDIANLSGIIENYPEDIRPERVLKFEEILPISAKESMEDVERVKEKIRNVLDRTSQKEDDDIGIIRNIKKNLIEKEARLV